MNSQLPQGSLPRFQTQFPNKKSLPFPPPYQRSTPHSLGGTLPKNKRLIPNRNQIMSNVYCDRQVEKRTCLKKKSRKTLLFNRFPHSYNTTHSNPIPLIPNRTSEPDRSPCNASQTEHSVSSNQITPIYTQIQKPSFKTPPENLKFGRRGRANSTRRTQPLVF